MTPSRSLDAVQQTIEFGATLLHSKAGDFFLKSPGMEPVHVERDVGEQICRHEVIRNVGPDSHGNDCYVLKPGGSFLGASDKSTSVSEWTGGFGTNSNSRYSIRD